jgi:hypothetical protein
MSVSTVFEKTVDIKETQKATLRDQYIVSISDSSGSVAVVNNKNISLTESTQLLATYDSSLITIASPGPQGESGTHDASSGTVERIDDQISALHYAGGPDLLFTRNADGYVIGISDGLHQWTYTRDTSNNITAWSFA